MRKETQQATASEHPSSVSRFALSDVELTMKAMRGIADVEAGRCAPVSEVRARVLSRYEPSGVCA